MAFVGGDALSDSGGDGECRRYLQLLDEVEEQAGTIDLELLKRQLHALYAEAAVVANAVDLMTIHGAKGLEWDVVLVPGLERRAQANKEKLLAWDEIGSRG